ncbi:MAG: NAD(P)/FAD-dependent oxidoreductase, partial [Alphaproteobacteria bacterium]|nr:NAD(P)/FAD-dependent oxidoreductase [Alphaproteobacteria bacterium]
RNAAGVEVDCGAVIIAGGAGAFGPNKPPIDGIEAYEGKSVFYMVRRREDFAGKRVVIAGGGDSAVDWALSLADIAKVSVVHRRDQFRAAPDNVARMKAHAGIELVIPYQLKGLRGQAGVLNGVEVATLDGDTKVLDADVLLAFYGLAAKLGPMADWGLTLSGHSIVIDPATAETSVSGVYSAGDIATYDEKLKLISVGFAEAAKAAHSAYRYIHPDKALHMEYSTSKGLPHEKGADIKTIGA